MLQKIAALVKRIFSPSAVVSITSLVLSIRLLIFIDRYAVNIYFSDQWEYVRAFIQNENVWGLFTWLVGPHRQGLAFVISGELAKLTHWNGRADAFFVGTLFILSTLTALVLKLRLFGKFVYGDILIPVVTLNLAQYETLIVVPNASHGPFPLLLLLLFGLSWSIQRRYVRYALALLCTFLLIYSGFGLVMGSIAPVLFALEAVNCYRSEKPHMIASMVAFFLSLAITGSFFIHYAFASDIDCFAPFQFPVRTYIQFASFLYANFLNFKGVGLTAQLVGTCIFGVICLVSVLLFIQIIKRGITQNTNRVIVAILLWYSLIFSLFAAIGRTCLGLYAADAPRYIPYITPAILGIYFCTLTIKHKKARWVLMSIYVLIFVISETRSFSVNEYGILYFYRGKNDWRNCYMVHKNIDYCNTTTGFIMLPNKPSLIGADVRFLETHQLNLYSK